CRAAGLSPDSVGDLAAARRSLAAPAGAAPFRLVLMDANLPGIDCAAWVGEMRAADLVPVLSCTTLGRDALVLGLAGAGLAEVPLLVKPVLPASGIPTLLRALGHAVAAPGAAHVDAAQAPAGDHWMPGLRVLLVDDHEINQELACEILRAAGILVSVADNGREAIEQLRREPFDLVLMDCQMPVMDGYEATLAIRADASIARLPILAMTANVMSGDRDRALASGMNDHIAKPIDIDAMFETLARWAPRPG
ncbi:MAG TPA: response regulator, partial [Burkholderiaceae bacterium]